MSRLLHADSVATDLTMSRSARSVAVSHHSVTGDFCKSVELEQVDALAVEAHRNHSAFCENCELGFVHHQDSVIRDVKPSSQLSEACREKLQLQSLPLAVIAGRTPSRAVPLGQIPEAANEPSSRQLHGQTIGVRVVELDLSLHLP